MQCAAVTAIAGASTYISLTDQPTNHLCISINPTIHPANRQEQQVAQLFKRSCLVEIKKYKKLDCFCHLLLSSIVDKTGGTSWRHFPRSLPHKILII